MQGPRSVVICLKGFSRSHKYVFSGRFFEQKLNFLSESFVQPRKPIEELWLHWLHKEFRYKNIENDEKMFNNLKKGKQLEPNLFQQI